MDLNARNIPAAKGGPWRPKGLGEVIVKPRFARLRVRHGEVVGDAAWKPILDRATHEKLVAMLMKPGRTRRVGGHPSIY